MANDRSRIEQGAEVSVNVFGSKAALLSLTGASLINGISLHQNARKISAGILKFHVYWILCKNKNKRGVTMIIVEAIVSQKPETER